MTPPRQSLGDPLGVPRPCFKNFCTKLDMEEWRQTSPTLTELTFQVSFSYMPYLSSQQPYEMAALLLPCPT